MTYTFSLPLFVMIPRKTKEDKKVSLNLNVYRNLHHQVNNEVKKLFSPHVGYPQFNAQRIVVSYVVSKRTKRRYDAMNVVSIVDKFFMDWLVNNEYIKDDDCNTVSYGSIVGKNGCESDSVIATVEILK